MAKKLVKVMVHVNEFIETQIEVDDSKNLETQVVDWAKREYPQADVVTDYFEEDDPFIAIYK